MEALLKTHDVILLSKENLNTILSYLKTDFSKKQNGQLSLESLLKNMPEMRDCARWNKCNSEQGVSFYHNTCTNETQWVKPEEYDDTFGNDKGWPILFYINEFNHTQSQPFYLPPPPPPPPQPRPAVKQKAEGGVATTNTSAKSTNGESNSGKVVGFIARVAALALMRQFGSKANKQTVKKRVR